MDKTRGNYKIDIEDFIVDIKLKNSCKTEFEHENYWNAVNNAMRHLEVRIREKSGLSHELVGVKLVTGAFAVPSGKLKVRICKTEEEEEGFQLILMGLIKFHRNAKAHDEGNLDRNSALSIIGYVDYIVRVIDTASSLRGEADKYF